MTEGEISMIVAWEHLQPSKYFIEENDFSSVATAESVEGLDRHTLLQEFGEDMVSNFSEEDYFC